jgi:hypothetical protein
MTDHFDLLTRFGIDLAVMGLLIFGLYYRRHRNKMLAVMSAMFNIFAFGVLATLSSVDFSIAAGFGLFAILALFSLRSEQIGHVEISYFFGAIAVAVITSVQGTALSFVGLVAGIVVLGAWLVDHPLILRGSNAVKVTLDRIDPIRLSDAGATRAYLSERLGVEVMSFEITGINYVNDLATLSVHYRKA